MSKQTINIGSAANDGTGDPLRTAFQKCNGNFDELYVGIDLSGYAPLASPTFTGDPKAPTPALSDSDTSIANTAYVQGNLANYAPLTNLASYLPLAGGTLTGNLTISSAGALVVQSTTVSLNPTTGALTVAGDIGAKGMYLGTDGLVVQGPGVVQSTSSSTSPTTGALTVAGGLGVGGDIYAASLWAGASPHGTINGAIKVGYAGGGTQYGMVMRPAADTTTAIHFANAANAQCGAITITPTTTAYGTSSDGRLKTDLQQFDAGPIIDRTSVYNFEWKVTPGERAYGVIAQEAIEIFPDAISHDEVQDTWGVDYSKYVPLLLQEIKSLRARVAALETVAV